jgi:hypothetical protein
MCSNDIENYVTYLNISVTEPFPVFFNWHLRRCLSFTIESSNGSGIIIPHRIQGFMIPSNKTVKFYSTSSSRVVVGPLYVPDFYAFPLTFDNGTSFYNSATGEDNITSIDIYGENWDESALAACDGGNIIVAAQELIAYFPNSQNCDLRYDTFCSSMSQPCDELYTGDPRCICYHEQRCLSASFGQGVVVPAACFGKGCQNYGYRSSQMQQYNCSSTLCTQFIELYGTDLYLAGNTTITCGNVPVPTEPPQPVPTDTPPLQEDTGLSVPVIVSISVFSVLFFMIISYIIGIYAHWW